LALRKYLKQERVFLRQVSLGVLNLLYKTLELPPLEEGGEKFAIPFYYDMGAGDEKFLQDAYLIADECVGTFAEGNYDAVPRGLIKIVGATIDSASLTNRYVRGIFEKLDNESAADFSSIQFQVPMQLNYECRIRVDSMLDSLIIPQLIINKFHRSIPFNVTWDGGRISSNAGFSDDSNTDTLFEWSYPEGKYTEVSFTIEVESYLPIYLEREEYEGWKTIHTTINNFENTIEDLSRRRPNHPNQNKYPEEQKKKFEEEQPWNDLGYDGTGLSEPF
jgi:hypothetical protein